MTIIAVKPGTEAAFDLVAKMVTSDKPRQQCMGRAIAAGIHETVESWLQQEIARGTDPVDLIAVVAEIGMQQYASVVGSVCDPEGFGPAAQAYLGDVANRILGFMAAVHAYRNSAEADQ